MSSSFLQDVIQGLSLPQKKLSSKYFYDDKGSRIFQDIMACDEYYLTNCEAEIFEQQADHIIDALFEGIKGTLQIVELGAGDGTKTQVLLSRMLERNCDFQYVPIDISQEAIDILSNRLSQTYPQLPISGICSEYFSGLDQLSQAGEQKAILFLGSTIGNFSRAEAERFLTQLQKRLLTGDQLLLGVDLKKDPEIIKAAYNDRGGHTRDFNLNLLERMNKELGANFDLSHFLHAPSYNPENGEARSYLVSTIKQDIYFAQADTTIHFDAWEAIHLEISKKYSLTGLNELMKASGYGIKKPFQDSKGFFVDLLTVKD